MQLSMDSNIAAFRRKMLKEQKSQLPFATARALTWTGREVKEQTERRIERAFDRPTSFTKRGVAAFPASKSRMYSRVLIKDRQAEYLSLQETGGTRTPDGRALVVPVGARTNRYGNLPRGGVRRMLARSDTFSGRVRGVAGIWQRTRGGSVKLLVSYEPRAEYRPRFEFAERARREARRRFPDNFERSFKQAMDTAR